MATLHFKKEDFVQDNEGQFQLEFQKEQIIGIGANITVERLKDDGEYEVVQAQIHRFDERVNINWSEPFDGRLIFEEY